MRVVEDGHVYESSVRQVGYDQDSAALTRLLERVA